MKVKLLLMMLVILSVVLAGCSSTSDVEPMPSEPEAIEEVPEVLDEPQMGEPEIIHVETDFEETLTDESSEVEIGVDIEIEADMAVATDCGSPDCFEEKFAACEAATYDAALSPMLAYRYEIQGPKNNGCEVMSYFTANPNPDWVGEEMTCVYDNSKDFLTSVGDVINSFNGQDRLGDCFGPLYILMGG